MRYAVGVFIEKDLINSVEVVESESESEAIRRVVRGVEIPGELESEDNIKRFLFDRGYFVAVLNLGEG